MPDSKPSGLPDQPPDPALFARPTNPYPAVALPEPTPEDPDRERVESQGATHVVLANRLGSPEGRDDYARGDRIAAADLPDGADVARLENLKPYPAIRTLTGDEKAENAARSKAKADADAKAKSDADARNKPPVKPEDRK